MNIVDLKTPGLSPAAGEAGTVVEGGPGSSPASIAETGSATVAPSGKGEEAEASTPGSSRPLERVESQAETDHTTLGDGEEGWGCGPNQTRPSPFCPEGLSDRTPRLFTVDRACDAMPPQQDEDTALALRVPDAAIICAVTGDGEICPNTCAREGRCVWAPAVKESLTTDPWDAVGPMPSGLVRRQVTA